MSFIFKTVFKILVFLSWQHLGNDSVVQGFYSSLSSLYISHLPVFQVDPKMRYFFKESTVERNGWLKKIQKYHNKLNLFIPPYLPLFLCLLFQASVWFFNSYQALFYPLCASSSCYSVELLDFSFLAREMAKIDFQISNSPLKKNYTNKVKMLCKTNSEDLI